MENKVKSVMEKWRGGKSIFICFSLVISVLLVQCQQPDGEETESISEEINENDLSIKIMSFNIQHGRTVEGNIDLGLAGNQINEMNPDIVALQEVDKYTNRSGNIDIAKILAELTDMEYIFGKAIDFQGGEYGLALLSKYPISEFKVHRLPNLGNAEQRIALEAIVEVSSSKQMRIVNTHLGFTNDDLIYAQSLRLDELFANDMPTLMAGDFNQEPDEVGMRYLANNWELTFKKNSYSFPASNPNKKIDYILKGPKHKWCVLNTQMGNYQGVSDHLPLFVELCLID